MTMFYNAAIKAAELTSEGKKNIFCSCEMFSRVLINFFKLEHQNNVNKIGNKRLCCDKIRTKLSQSHNRGR